MKKFILTHKDIKPIEGFEIIDNRENSELDHRIWSEIAGLQILYNKLTTEKGENDMLLYDENEFISLNHYRRMIDPDCVNRFYIPQPIVFNGSLAEQYAECHNIEDLKLCGKSLKEEFPHLAPVFEKTMNDRMFIPYIICVLTVGQFKDYFNFLYKVLTNFNKKLGTNTYEERLDYIRRHPELYTGENKNSEPEYQARIESFLAERLATAYFNVCSQRTLVFPCKIIKTEGAF